MHSILSKDFITRAPPNKPVPSVRRVANSGISPCAPLRGSYRARSYYDRSFPSGENRTRGVCRDRWFERSTADPRCAAGCRSDRSERGGRLDRDRPRSDSTSSFRFRGVGLRSLRRCSPSISKCKIQRDNSRSGGRNLLCHRQDGHRRGRIDLDADQIIIS